MSQGTSSDGEMNWVNLFFTDLTFVSGFGCMVLPFLLLSDIGQDVSVTLPAASTSYQVTGLRLGRRYRFTVQPTFTRGLGAESFVDERTGTTPFTFKNVQYLNPRLHFSFNPACLQCVWVGVWMWSSWCLPPLIE